MAKNKVDELVVDIKGDVSDLLRKLEIATDSTASAGKRMGASFGVAKAGIGGATKALGTFGLAVQGAEAALAPLIIAMDHINSKVGLARMADRVGINVKQFQKLSFAAKSIGVDSEVMADAIKDLTVKITDASLGAQAYEDALNAVGLKSAELVKLSPEAQFRAFADAIAGASREMGDFAADEINDSMYRLIPLLRQGSEGFDKIGKKAEEAGAILSESDLNELKKSQKAVKELGLAWDGIKTQLALIVSGPLTDFLNGILSINKAAKNIPKTLGSATPTAYGATIGALGGHGPDKKARDPNLPAPYSLTDGQIVKEGEKAFYESDVPLGPEGGELLKEIMTNGGLGNTMTGASGMDIGAGLGGGFGQSAQGSLDDLNARFPMFGPTEEEFEELKAIALERQGFLSSEIAEFQAMEREKKAKEEQGFRDREYAAEERQVQRIIALAKGSSRDKLRLASGLANDLLTISKGKSRKLFEVSKALSTADATVSAITGATNAFRDVPYPYNFVASASVLAAGMANVQKIQSQTFGGGSGGGGASSTPDTGLGNGDAIGGGQQGPTNITEATINITGDNISGDSARALVAQLREYQEDGGELLIK